MSYYTRQRQPLVPGLVRKEFDPNQPRDEKGKWTDKVVFDAVGGLGAVPFNQEVGYHGFETVMTADDFLGNAARLTHRKEKTLAFLKESLKAGRSFGQPFLNVAWNKEKNTWDVYGHEGRHRVTAVAEMFGGGTKIPVHVFPQYMRAKHVTDEMRRASFRAEDIVRTEGLLKRTRELLLEA